jgi:hypothetical protein
MTVPTGLQTITITGTESGTGGNSHTASVTFTITATNQTFTIAETNGPTTYSVAPGATASVPITVNGTNGFIVTTTSPTTTALPLTYSCTQSSIPSEASCSFSPGSGNSISNTSVTLNIATTAPTAQLRPPPGHGSRIFYALLLPGLFGIVFAAGSRTRSARLLGLIVVLGVSTLGLGSCGGSGGSSGGQSNPGTPAGSYSVVVNATTAGPNALTSTFTVSLTVQ